jgi:arylsulfatase A-like enzyme
VISILCLFVLVPVLLGGCDASARRPRDAACRGCSVLLVSFDTVRADHVGAYGYTRPTSPNIDALAARSVVFRNAISQSSWTRPAHASILTALYPSEHGMVAMSRATMLPSGVRTLPAVLSERGYATAAFTGGGNMSAHFGFDSGFDRYESLGRRFDESLDEVEKWIAARDGAPFFLLLHGYDAHKPYRSAPEDREALGLAPDRPRVGIQRACGEGRRPADLEDHMAEYDAAIRHGDRGIGKSLDLLARLGRADDTVVVLTSDHGEEFLEHGGCFHVRTLYREIVHVPLLIAVPGVPARTVEGLVPASVSIAPTILDVVGIQDRELRGPSLAPYLAGKRQPTFEYVVSETAIRRPGARIEHIRALTGAREKLIHWSIDGRYELFDLAADPGEQKPRSGAPRARHLLRHLDLWLAAHPPRMPPRPAAALSSALEKDLRALGYVD